ncbi:hypothetical protein ACN47E_008460 [Coniothyrium glycines]
MKYSGLFYINNPSTGLDTALSYVNELVQGIETSLQQVTRQSPWSLSYRAYRNPVPPNPQSPSDADSKAQQFAHTYQHMLSHTGIAADRTYIFIQPPNEPGVVASIPRQQQDAHASMTRHQMAALWTQRHVLRVEQGITYDGGLFTIQVGELRATREGPQSSAVNSPGVVVCISTVVGSLPSDDNTKAGHFETPSGHSAAAPEDQDVDFEFAQAMLKDCWRKIKGDKEFGGRAEVKETMMNAAITTSTEQEREASVRMWCELLRMRG